MQFDETNSVRDIEEIGGREKTFFDLLCYSYFPGNTTWHFLKQACLGNFKNKQVDFLVFLCEASLGNFKDKQVDFLVFL